MRRWWRDNHWFVMGATVVLIVAAGVWGFWSETQPDKWHRFLDALYQSLLMFWMNAVGSSNQPSLVVSVARLLAVAVVIYAGARVVLSVAADGVDRLMSRFKKDHLVVCGLGTLGSEAVRKFASDPRWNGVVVIEKSENTTAVAIARAAGARVVIGDATDSYDLRKARVDRASYVVVVTGADDASAHVAQMVEQCAREAGRERKRPLVCSVHISDYQTFTLIRQRSVESLADSAFRLDYFNVWETSARAVLEAYPVPESTKAESKPTVMVVGTRPVALALVTQLARTEVFSDLLVVGEDAHSLVENACAYSGTLLSRLQGVDLCLDATMVTAIAQASNGVNPQIVYVCGDDDVTVARSVLTLSGWSALDGVKLVAISFEPMPLLGTGDGSASGVAGDIAPFACLPHLFSPEEVLWGRIVDQLAPKVHRRYVERERSKSITPMENPSMVNWDELPLRLQESNRFQVRDFWNKLKDVGLTVEPMICGSDLDESTFTDDDVKKLARKEHDRWMRDLRDAGWEWGPAPKAPQATPPTHPLFKPYDELPIDERKKDEAPIRDIPELLAQIGFRVIKAP